MFNRIGISGFYLSFSRNLQFTFLLSALSLYLVFTGWFSIKGKTQGITLFDKLGLVFILLFSVACFLFAIFGIAFGWDYPASEPPYGAYAFIGAIAALFLLGDLQFVKALAPAPSARLRRHLTRMCSSMLIAITIFFLGNNHVLPDFMRNPYALLTPIVLVILVLLIYRTGFQRIIKGQTK